MSSSIHALKSHQETPGSKQLAEMLGGWEKYIQIVRGHEYRAKQVLGGNCRDGQGETE